ncbi:putative flippase GtrA [Fontibacillus phaseoli]|uniref:Putative flippase GtrA n=1 Tax=Fontibacillus phaseoli TaxID=1416533 RepID=A0A369B4N5_9BACL|nr:GtrA family protein [Fontibacillus phaseoli]RCX16255.1 putative flippase GtrA [Fontibacillus phaseoli]
MLVKWLHPSLFQFIKFNMVGVLNTTVDFAVFAALTGWGIGNGTAQILSYSVGTVNSFLMNKGYTFKDREVTGRMKLFEVKQFLRFVVLNLIVLTVSLVLLTLMASHAGLHALIAKLGVTCITLILNFYGSRKWVFRERRYSPGD